MKVIYAILTATGWMWLAIVLFYLCVMRPVLQRSKQQAPGFDAVTKHEE